MAATALLALGLGAAAETRIAVTTDPVHLRAGPGRDYPVVRVLPRGLQVTVEGCLERYTWCDVMADADRGWVHGARLRFTVDGRELRAPEAGALLGLAIIGFALGSYWADHYPERPWYPQRHRWVPPPPPPPPPPPVPRVPPPRPAPPPAATLPPPLRWLPPGTVVPSPQPKPPPRATPPSGHHEGRPAPPPATPPAPSPAAPRTTPRPVPPAPSKAEPRSGPRAPGPGERQEELPPHRRDDRSPPPPPGSPSGQK